jgi:flagellar hook-basal body complex protein FliE
MPVGPIDPSMAAMGAEWQIPGISGVDGTSGGVQDAPGAADSTEGQGESFGSMLADQVQQLEGLQTHAAGQSQALAAGEAVDPSEVVMAVEKARLGMQLAGQIRTKLVDVQQEIFRTQV